jgi:hypothetical protein
MLDFEMPIREQPPPKVGSDRGAEFKSFATSLDLT